MADNVRLYVGTEHGTFVWRSTNGGWQEVASGVGGRLVWSTAGGHQHPERVFTCVTHDGLYRTADGGDHWARVLEGNIRAVRVDPTNDDVIYAGADPVQLYRSEDRGDTWEELQGLWDLPQEVRDKWRHRGAPEGAPGHVCNIFVHPDDPQTLYLSLEHGGIVRSFDRGATWEDVSEGIDYLDIHVVSNLPHRFDRYFTATARGFFASDDPAQGWSRAETGFTRDYFHDFTFLPPAREGDNPTMLVATAQQSPPSWQRPTHAEAAVFRSVDCAASWHQVGEGLPDSLEPGIWGLEPHPNEPAGAFLGVGYMSRGDRAQDRGRLYVTRDRGDSWDDLNIDLWAVRGLWVAPT